MDQIRRNGPNQTELDQNRPNDQKWTKWTEVDLFGPNWTEVGVYYLYLLKLMKMTYGSCPFLDPLKHKLFNLVIQLSDYLDKLFKSRLTQENHIM